MIKFLHIRRRRMVVPPSAFTLPLERVREIREHTDWQPFTPPSTIQERADRLTRTRQQIQIPPLAHERETHEAETRYFRTAGFWRPILYSIAGFTMLALAIYLCGPEPSKHTDVRQASIIFPAGAYTNLTESVAERFARRALVSASNQSEEWRLLSSCPTENGALFLFRHMEDRFGALTVRVSLEASNGRIVCTVDP